jgi:hypothetical protein
VKEGREAKQKRRGVDHEGWKDGGSRWKEGKKEGRKEEKK